MKRGYVRIYRCIEDNILFRDPEPANKKSAWIDLILMANHKKVEMLVGTQKIVIKRGQKFTSIRKLALRWGWSVNRTLRYLKLLEREGMVYRESVGNGTLLTLVNYGKFQGDKNTNGNTDEYTDGDTNGDTDGDTGGIQTIMTNNDLKNDLKNDSKKDPDFLLGNGKPKPKRE